MDYQWFPVYGMVSSWSTHEKLACPYYMKNNKAFMLEIVVNNVFYCHQWFLLPNHKYIKNINDFFVGRVERDVEPSLPLGEKLYDIIS